MIIRIVKMQFHPEQVSDFVEIFRKNQHRIAGFPGCNKVDLLNDVDHPEVFFTYSHWESPSALEDYRHSDTFRDIWAQTKVLFSAAPMAWSTKKVSV